MTKHWILNNIMGLSFCLLGIRQGPRCEVAFFDALSMLPPCPGTSICRASGLELFCLLVFSFTMCQLAAKEICYSIPNLLSSKRKTHVSWSCEPFVVSQSDKGLRLLGIPYHSCIGPGFGYSSASRSSVQMSWSLWPRASRRSLGFVQTCGKRDCSVFEAPMKLMLPRDFGGCGEFKWLGCIAIELSKLLGKRGGSFGQQLRFSMLGLGDIAVPGMFCALLAKWDAVLT